jgi:hypothetical protein
VASRIAGWRTEVEDQPFPESVQAHLPPVGMAVVVFLGRLGIDDGRGAVGIPAAAACEDLRLSVKSAAERQESVRRSCLEGWVVPQQLQCAPAVRRQHQIRVLEVEPLNRRVAERSGNGAEMGDDRGLSRCIAVHGMLLGSS